VILNAKEDLDDFFSDGVSCYFDVISDPDSDAGCLAIQPTAWQEEGAAKTGIER
jgi:hypothetical protein